MQRSSCGCVIDWSHAPYEQKRDEDVAKSSVSLYGFHIIKGGKHLQSKIWKEAKLLLIYVQVLLLFFGENGMYNCAHYSNHGGPLLFTVLWDTMTGRRQLAWLQSIRHTKKNEKKLQRRWHKDFLSFYIQKVWRTQSFFFIPPPSLRFQAALTWLDLFDLTRKFLLNFKKK